MLTSFSKGSFSLLCHHEFFFCSCLIFHNFIFVTCIFPCLSPDVNISSVPGPYVKKLFKLSIIKHYVTLVFIKYPGTICFGNYFHQRLIKFVESSLTTARVSLVMLYIVILQVSNKLQIPKYILYAIRVELEDSSVIILYSRFHTFLKLHQFLYLFCTC